MSPRAQASTTCADKCSRTRPSRRRRQRERHGNAGSRGRGFLHGKRRRRAQAPSGRRAARPPSPLCARGHGMDQAGRLSFDLMKRQMQRWRRVSFWVLLVDTLTGRPRGCNTCLQLGWLSECASYRYRKSFVNDYMKAGSTTRRVYPQVMARIGRTAGNIRSQTSFRSARDGGPAK